MRHLRACLLAVLLVADVAAQVAAPPRALTIWTTRALATVLRDTTADVTHDRGYALQVVSDLPNGFEQRLEQGERCDLLITGADPLRTWVERGRLVRDTVTPIARSGIGVAVKAGRPRPDVRTTEAFVRALRAARSIAFLKVGSGLEIDRILTSLDLTRDIGAKAVRPDTDVVATLVAEGRVDLGLVVTTQIMTTPGVVLAGPLPPDLQSYVTFAAGVCADARERDGAADVIRFLKSPRATAVMRAQGMEPMP